ncbi:Uu.00g126310.m01.CDS01 [Anthostomella pinea]|uniref:Uu.00g126310.m01.CDS01 n=1 Tax=Anthostomella pinea TaxID=933095 RepID=A0AAI8YHX2_9PEZI|nr:Uu.00g126310.m01.CDS01 [Anthostomella pinea]
MNHWLQCYAFDVISMITYSRRMGFLDHGEDIGDIMMAIDSDMTYATKVGLYPSFHPYLFFLRNYAISKKEVGRAYVINFTRNMITQHQANPKVEPDESSDEEGGEGAVDFLTKLLKKHSNDPEVFTSYHVLATCGANMIAGSDTTSITLSAILYYLLKNTSAYQRLRDEVDSTGKELTFAQAQNLPYLQAVIKEALRLHPATGLPLERVVPSGGATIAGVFFPKGCIVGINTWV